MDLEQFDGHLDQLDFQEGRVHRLHLVNRDGLRLVLTIEDSDDLDPIPADYSVSLAIFVRDQRPKVTIARRLLV
jgi:hypothetical protein